MSESELRTYRALLGLISATRFSLTCLEIKLVLSLTDSYHSVTLGKASCNLSRNFVTTQVVQKIA